MLIYTYREFGSEAYPALSREGLRDRKKTKFSTWPSLGQSSQKFKINPQIWQKFKFYKLGLENLEILIPQSFV